MPRKATIDNHDSYHFTMTNTFADTVMGESRRVVKVFSYSDHCMPDRVGERWLRDKFTEIYGDRGAALYHHPKLVTKMKWGCGVTARFQSKKSGIYVYPVYRLAWNEYNPITREQVSKARYISLQKLSHHERKVAIHNLHLEAVRLRAKASMSELDEGVLGLDFDLSKMPTKSYKL
ncbi:hypothetical protein VCHA53O466_140161 [Vibrio chagasii]|nr:hypothetical protein VCHA53O466_140161 [Vibrio chagasii]